MARQEGFQVDHEDPELVEELLNERWLDPTDLEDFRELGMPPSYMNELRTAIVIDNLPKITQEKFEKLKRAVVRKFSEFGEIAENSFHMPLDPATGKCCCVIVLDKVSVLVNSTE